MLPSLLCSCALVNRNAVDRNQIFFSLQFSLKSKILLTSAKFNFAMKTFSNYGIR